MEPRAPAPTLPSRIGDAFLARPGLSGRWPVALQLVLILLWHPVTYFLIVNPVTADLAPAVVTGAARFWQELDLRVDYRTQSVLFEPLPSGPLPQTAGLLLIWIMAEGALAWAVFFGLVRVPRGYGESGLRIFVRSWWRAWLWATGLFPLGACGLIVLEPLQVTDWIYGVFGLLVLWGYLFGAPAFLAGRELRRRRPRLARWRPVCPECGYNLRHLRGERCPECGAAFPTRSRVFRRWAIRRLVWDRVQRGSLLFAYVRSVFLIVVCPCAAARRLAMPDRYGRAVRWAVVHIVLAALVGTAMAAAPYIALWTHEALFGPLAWMPSVFVVPELRGHVPTVGSVLWWSLHALVAWSLTLAVLPLLGIALGHLVRRRHPLARRGVAKWSLYACVVPLVVLVVLAVCYGYSLASRWSFNAAATLNRLCELPPERPPIVILAGLYAVWWARGVCANPYLRIRDTSIFLLSVFLFIAAWLILTRIFFDPGALVQLL